jgi:hypothetical protein
VKSRVDARDPLVALPQPASAVNEEDLGLDDVFDEMMSAAELKCRKAFA